VSGGGSELCRASVVDAAVHKQQRAREKWEHRGEEGECSAFQADGGEVANGRSTAKPRGASIATRGQQLQCTVSALFNNFKLSIPPQTYNWNSIFRVSVTPKPRWVSKNSINKSCRSTRHLWLFLKRQSVIRPGWRDTRLQRRVNENWNLSFSPLGT
jgi:hypothetical protein